MNATEIAAVLSDLQIDRIRIQNQQVIGCCPIHGERNPSFGVSIVKEGHPWNCFACHERGKSLPSLVMKVKGINYAEACAYLQKFGDYEVLPMGDARLISFDCRFDVNLNTEVDREVLEGYPLLGWKARQYLRKRGIADFVFEKASLRCFNNRILFVWYEGLNPVGLTSRSYVDDHDKYRGLPLFGFKKHQHLYMASGARTYTVNWLYICEGEIDALRLESLGYDACALSGTVMTKAQVDKLLGLTAHVVLVFDNDEEGMDGAENAKRLLSKRLVVFEPDKVPDDYTDPAGSPLKCMKALLDKENLKLAIS